MDIELIKLLINMGVPLLLIYWFLTDGLNKFGKVGNKVYHLAELWIMNTSKFEKLEGKDDTLSGNISELYKEIAILKDNYLQLKEEIKELKLKIAEQEGWITDIMIKLNFQEHPRWRDPRGVKENKSIDS